MKKLTVVVAVLLLGVAFVPKVHAEDCGIDGDNIVWGT